MRRGGGGGDLIDLLDDWKYFFRKDMLSTPPPVATPSLCEYIEPTVRPLKDLFVSMWCADKDERRLGGSHSGTVTMLFFFIRTEHLVETKREEVV